jgi:hypothetical protein
MFDNRQATDCHDRDSQVVIVVVVYDTMMDDQVDRLIVDGAGLDPG